MNRIEPNMPVAAYKTYRILSPQSTHFRPATCAEAECEAHLNGWRSTIDEATDLGQRQAHYIRKESGRRFVEERLESGLTRFEFEAGQQCFAGGHQVRLDRPEHYLLQDGDWRGNPTGRNQALTAQDWIDDFGEHQQRLADQLERG
ncbi:hypothetical protein [Kitasatospora sp. A2-31]|uniref:hypothetical protein n=1 Tax=Kitasatospora sp. A2-31 TaxID=2916414 RepID=UPI001EE85F5A|nr:hypothetical protein [Kitasatospora sp. A2-31]MCG6493441.1 hypothetical protein [Kitasatospora sp. A2-31]